MELKLQLQSLKKGGMSVTDFDLKVRNISDQLMAAGELVNEKDLVVCIFGDVGSDFNPCVASMNMNSTVNATELTIEEVLSNLLSYEHMLGE